MKNLSLLLCLVVAISCVGLKPTVGLLSRGGIVPISSTLDTPGPMTKFVVDNAILLSAMTGTDEKDPASASTTRQQNYYGGLRKTELKGKRFRAIKSLKGDTLYVRAINDLKKAGVEIVEFEAEEMDLPNFIRLLNLDIKKDLPEYFKTYGKVGFTNIQEGVDYNTEDSLARAPYGQALFLGIIKDSASTEEFAALKDTLRRNGMRFFEKPMKEHDLDAIFSINNYHARFAAVAKYPAITVPMGYTSEKTPINYNE